MPYSKQTWNDSSSGGTPLSAARLNHMEDGISDADTAAASAQTTAAAASSTATAALSAANAAQTAATAAQATANTAIPLSTVTAAGDMIVGTGAGAVTRVPVLADSRMFEADSTNPAGVKWGRKITVSSTAPAGPRVGDLWLKI